MREEKTSHQRLPKACCFGQESAAWRWQALCSGMVVQMVLWCYPRQKQTGWWEEAGDAELGCRKAKTLVLLCLEEVRCASPGQLWFCSLWFWCNERYHGKEGNFVPALASIFPLHSKAESVAVLGDSFGHLNEHLSMTTGEEPWSAGHCRLRWVGSFGALAQGSDA